MKNNNKRTVTIAIGAAVILLIGLLIVLNMDFTDNDNFAKCLKAAGVTMYGTDWCPHCKAMKGKIGSSMQYMSYVDCEKQKDKCQLDGVTMYPAFRFADGSILYGEMELELLGSKAGCTVE